MSRVRTSSLALTMLVACCSSAWAAIAIDVTTIFKDQSPKSATVTTPNFSTAAANELLLAFVSADYLSGPNTTVTSVSGGGLTWVLVRRTNVQRGTAEIWRAFAPSVLTNVSVTARLSQSVVSSMTVMSFTGVDPSGTSGSGAIGATGTGNASSGAPSVMLTTTRSNSLVIGVGTDYDNPIARTPAAGQLLVHTYLAPVGDTYWVQRQASTTPLSGQLVAINDTAPTGDRYNMSSVEILAAPVGGPTFTVSGAISPAATGSGAIVTLTQNGATAGSATVDGSGNYAISGVPNGTYVATPAKTGVSFAPVSRTITVGGANLQVPTFTASQTTWNITGTVSPAASGSGTLLTLSSGATATANGSGAYAFTGVANGTYTVTPSKSGLTFNPTQRTVTVNGGSVTGVNFTAQTTGPALLYPDLSDIIPSAGISIVMSGGHRMFQYTHDTLNGGPGPLVIQPAYNPASGVYQGAQYIYSVSGNTWTIQRTIPIAGAFIFHPEHGHFHYPFATYGLYAVGADGGPGIAVAVSEKIGFCIADSFIYDSTLPHAGAIGNLGSCSDPTSLRGLDIGAVDEYDRTDDGQSINIDALPDGNYWLRAIVDPDNFLAETNKSNNETDVLLSIRGNSVQVLNTVEPALSTPPAITLTVPGSAVSGTVTLTATTATGNPVQMLLDGRDLGTPVGLPYTVSWDTTLVPDGTHWLAAQTTDSAGVVGTSPVVQVTVANAVAAPPTVQITSPAEGATLAATVTVFAEAAGGRPIANVTFFVDGTQLGQPVTTPPFMVQWDTTSYSGMHVLTATAIDAANLTASSAPITVTVDNTHPPAVIGKESPIFVDGASTMITPAFSTTTPGDLLVAFVGYDGPPGSAQTATVSGAGLTWTLVMRSNTQAGTSEIWTARPAGTLTNVTVQAVPGASGFHGSMTVIPFTNAAGIGVVGRTGAPTGAPDIFLPGISAGNWVFAVGNDWDRAVIRTPVSGQVLVHQRVDTSVGDTFWVQSTTAPSTANGLVDIHDSAPTDDRWNYAAAEIVAKRQ